MKLENLQQFLLLQVKPQSKINQIKFPNFPIPKFQNKNETSCRYNPNCFAFFCRWCISSMVEYCHCCVYFYFVDAAYKWQSFSCRIFRCIYFMGLAGLVDRCEE